MLTMWPFRKRSARTNPTLETQGLRLTYNLRDDWWEFSFADLDFLAFGARFVLPELSQLEAIVSDIDALLPEMQQRIRRNFQDIEGIQADDGESFSIHLFPDASDKFEVFWQDGRSWGDFCGAFVVHDHAIAEEIWGS